MLEQSFQKKIETSSKRNKSKVILALDLEHADKNILLSKCLEILEKVMSHICAVKVNRHLVLPLGLYGGVKKIITATHDKGLPTIMDCKINDVGHTNRVIAKHYFDTGFDALIANPFIGWEGGLAPVFELAEKRGKGVLLLTYMSHKGAWEGYGQKVLDNSGTERFQYLVFAEKALQWNAAGVIVGATYPEKIREVNSILKGEVPVYSPGVGAQGGKIKEALVAGTDYFIIGRSIIKTEDPYRAVMLFNDIINNY